MEPGDLLRMLTRRLRVILAVGLAGLAVATALVLVLPSSYAATSRMFVSIRTATNVQDVTSGASFAQSIVKSYAQVAQSPLVLAPVIEQLGLHESEQQLADHVSATASLDTVIIDVTVDDSDPVRAQQIANAITARLPAVVDDLTTVKADAAAVRITRIQAATLGVGRESPKASVLLPVGLLLGLLVGVLAVLGWEAATRRVHSTRDAARVTGLPVLAGLPDRRGKQGRLPVTASAPGSDAIRVLRAAVLVRTGLARSRSIVLTGTQRRVGTTAVAANLAIALAEGGSSVALVEANLRTPSLSHLLDLPTHAGLDEVLRGEVDLDAALTPWGEHGLMVLVGTSAPGGGADLLDGPTMREVLDRLAERFDVVLIDTPDLGSAGEAATLAAQVDGALVVVEAGRTGARSLRDGLEALTALDGEPLGLVVTRLPRRGADAPRVRT